MALERELAVFEAHRAEWVAEHEGQFVAIQDENVAGFFPLWEAALKAAYKQYGIGRGPFLIKEVKLVDRIEFIGLTAQGSLPCFGVWRMQQLQQLYDYLSNESEERMKQSIARKRDAHCLAGATEDELRESKALAESMVGHNLPSNLIKGSIAYARIQTKIGIKLEAEARQLSSWADLVMGIIKQSVNPA